MNHNQSTPRKIAGYIKRLLTDLTELEVRRMMKQHFIQMRLMSVDDAWKVNELEELDEFLLPNDINKAKIDDFLDQVVYGVESNPYLSHFLEKIENKHIECFLKKVETEGSQVFPSIVTYALSLDRLTKAMREDWKVIEACKKEWKVARTETEMVKHMMFFERTKLVSVEVGIKCCIRYQKSGHVPRQFLKTILPANIVEAVLEDLRLGYKDNAVTGWTLSINRPGRKVRNERTGAGPSRWSDDRKAILISVPLPEKWADLYQTWNLAFVSHYDEFPYFMVKLLIPQVSHYHESPDEYMYNRALALYAQLHYSFMGRADLAKQGRRWIKWNDKELSLFWGKVNKESTKEYIDELNKLSPSRRAKLKSKLRNLENTIIKFRK